MKRKKRKLRYQTGGMAQDNTVVNPVPPYRLNNQYGGVIKDNRGQHAFPGKVTEIDSNLISMRGVNYPVLGVDNLNNQKMMQPGASYQFPGSSVTEYPMMDSPITGKAAVNTMMAGKQAVNKGMMQDGGFIRQGDKVVAPKQTMNWELQNNLEEQVWDKVFFGPMSPYREVTDPKLNESYDDNYYRNFDEFKKMMDKRKYLRENNNMVPVAPKDTSVTSMIPYVKYGGSSDSCFPDEISFPEQRKNDFLKFLRETSFNKIKDELSDEQQQYDDYMKKGGWIQKATKGMRKDKPCTGAKFGSSSCPAGSKRYNLAKTFKKMNKQDGGTPMQQYLQKYPDRPATDTLTTGHGPYEMLDSDQFPDTTGYQRVKRTSIDQSPIYRGPEEQRRVDDLQNSFYQKYADPEWGESILDYERWTEDQRNQLPLRKTQTQHPYYPTNKPSLQGGGSFFDPYKTNVPYDVKNLKRRNNNPYNPPWDYIPNTGQKWQPHTDMSWMDTQQASNPNKLDYSPQQGFSQGQSFGLPPQPSAMDVNSDYYNMENVNQRASDESGEGITGRPNWKDRWWAGPEQINAGLEGVTSIFNMFDRQKKEKELRKRTAADNLWASSAGSRGDYTTNNGYFRPDQMTPVQFPGAAGFQQYQEGGQYEADETEIQDLISQGYQISYID